MFFFFNDTATTEIYTLSLHDALPISPDPNRRGRHEAGSRGRRSSGTTRSEEHTSELQSRPHLVCRLLLEKKKKIINNIQRNTIQHRPPDTPAHYQRSPRQTQTTLTTP